MPTDDGEVSLGTPSPVSDPARPGWSDARNRLLARGLVRAGLVTYLFSSLTLLANLVSGIVSARALGAQGRGVAVALTAVTQLAGFLFAMGAAQSLSYFIARRPQDGPRLFTTWLVMLLPLTAVAIAVSQALLPTLFAADDGQAVAVGRWFLFTIVLVVGLELTFGLLLGVADFTVYNALRFAQPALMTAAFVVLWPLDALTVQSALIAASASTALVLAVGLARAGARLGLGRPDLRLGLHTVWYGLRGQGTILAANVTARLDLAMLPAFVAAASVGLYSVATNVSLTVYQVSSTFAALVLPVAARDVERAPQRVVASLWGTLVVSTVLAVGLAVFAGPLLGAIYGEEFAEAAEPLRLILPGAVLFAGSTILTAGVYAAGRPFTATIAQVIGMGVTVVGLFAFLRSGGVTAAALVSTVSYATVFATTLLAYQKVTGTPWGAFLPTPERLRALAR